MGHDVHLAFGPIYGPEGSLLDRVEKFRTDDGRGITTHIVPNMVRQIDPIKDRRCYNELRALIRDLKPDIVHTHSSKAGIIGRAAAWTLRTQRWSSVSYKLKESSPDGPYYAKVPDGIDPALYQASLDTNLLMTGIIHTIHGPPFMPLDGSPLRRAKTAAINRAYILAERHAARRCHLIVSVADAMTELFLSKGIGRREQYVTVHSGMETERFLTPAPDEDRATMRRELGLQGSDIVIGTVARLGEHKGHDDLLDALGPDLKSRPNLKLLWVGDGWWRCRLTARARAFGLSVLELDQSGKAANRQSGKSEPIASLSTPHSPLSSQVILTGLIPSERVPAHIRAMDILAHPSYREGLPRTVPQALLCGVVPVAYDVDGTREACIDGQTGSLVPLADRQALRRAILDLADNPTERFRLATAGRELCRTRFSAETMVASLAKVYERALNQARSVG
jgi:glycosyltransferase involved in cell wall biosynthesis